MRAGEFGMRVGYHNHWAEFRTLDKTTLIDFSLKETGLEVLIQFDTDNAMGRRCDGCSIAGKHISARPRLFI